MAVDVVNSLSLVWQRKKGRQFRVVGVLSAVVHIFSETAMHAKSQASNRMAKANRASHGPRVSPHSQAKVRVKQTRENPMENSTPKKQKFEPICQSLHKSKTSKIGLSGLKNSKSLINSGTQESAYVCTTDLSWNDGWSFDEWNDGWSSVGCEVWEQTYDTSASSFSLRFGCQCHQLSEAVRMGEDEPGHRTCSEHIPIELGSRWSRRWKILSYCWW